MVPLLEVWSGWSLRIDMETVTRIKLCWGITSYVALLVSVTPPEAWAETGTAGAAIRKNPARTTGATNRGVLMRNWWPLLLEWIVGVRGPDSRLRHLP
jgi:hypothetical protein